MDYSRFDPSSRRDGFRSRLLAKLLAGAWRSCPPVLEHYAEELEEIAPLVIESGAAPILWRRLSDPDSLELQIAQQLQQAYRHSIIQAEIYQHEIKQAFAQLRSVGAEPLLVKGWVLARLYPEVGLRPCGDIDLCVHPADYDIAGVTLDKWMNHHFAIDLHEGFSSLDHASADELYARSRLVSLGDLRVRVLAPEDHLRLICIHFLRHGGFRPLWLCDIAAAVESRAPDFDWDICLGSNRRRADWVLCSIELAHQLLEADVSGTPVEFRPKQLPGWLVPNVLTRWEAPDPRNYGIWRHQAPMKSYIRHPSKVMAELRRRWPGPIEATVNIGGAFNEFPRLPFQIGECLSRGEKFFGGVARGAARRSIKFIKTSLSIF